MIVAAFEQDKILPLGSVSFDVEPIGPRRLLPDLAEVNEQVTNLLC